MRHLDLDERRARLAARHHLSVRASSVEAAAERLAGLHASDPCSVYLAAWARVEGLTVADMEEALYDRRSLVRMLGMRRTMFVVPVEHAAVMDAACTKALAPAERRKLVQLVEAQGLAKDGAAWLADLEARTLDLLAVRGEATAAQLAAEIPDLTHKLAFGEGKTWAGTMGMSTRVLFLLATEGRIVRGRPLGSWISSQYRWTTTASWLGATLPEIDPPAARTELLRRWLQSFGPGTETDIRWWTGWAAKHARTALAALDVVEVRLDDTVGHVLPDDVDTAAPPTGRRVVLLPSLDPTVMGWKERDWYLGPHTGPLFDRNGNAGPTVWVDGRIVGGWGQRRDGRVVTGLLEGIDAEAADLLEAEAAALTEWLAGTRVVPRFPTPLQRELTG